MTLLLLSERERESGRVCELCFVLNTDLVGVGERLRERMLVCSKRVGGCVGRRERAGALL